MVIGMSCAHKAVALGGVEAVQLGRVYRQKHSRSVVVGVRAPATFLLGLFRLDG